MMRVEMEIMELLVMQFYQLIVLVLIIAPMLLTAALQKYILV